MLIWINGSFGSGKSTLAARLLETTPDAVLFDPEEVGYLVRRVLPLPPSGDFQDLVAWRSLTAAAALAFERSGHSVVVTPMTLVSPSYRDEIFGTLVEAGVAVQHFWLRVPTEELSRRIRRQVLVDDPGRNAEIAAWREAQVARCVAAEAELPDDVVLLDGTAPTDALADQVLAEALTGTHDQPVREGNDLDVRRVTG